MYKLYNFHLLNNSRTSYNLKIFPENGVTPSPPPPPPLGNNHNRINTPSPISHNFLSMITNAKPGKGCSSCGGR